MEPANTSPDTTVQKGKLSIGGIYARNGSFSSAEACHNQTDPLPGFLCRMASRTDLSPNVHPAEVPPFFGPPEVGVFWPSEVLPKTRPAGARIFRGYAHAGGGADEPFNSDIGALLPIALWGRTSL